MHMTPEQFIQALKAAVENIPPGFKVEATYHHLNMGYMGSPPGNTSVAVKIIPFKKDDAP